MDVLMGVKIVGGLILLLFVITAAQRSIKAPSKETKSAATESGTISNPSPTLILTPTHPPAGGSTATTQQIIPTSSPMPTSSQPKSFLSIDIFIYPNSKQIKKEGGNLVFESTDSSQSITDWYKEKIKGLGMSAKSFVQTSTNGNILNKLAGSDGTTEVNIEIKKQNNASQVIITVSVQLEDSSSSSVKIKI